MPLSKLIWPLLWERSMFFLTRTIDKLTSVGYYWLPHHFVSLGLNGNFDNRTWQEIAMCWKDKIYFISVLYENFVVALKSVKSINENCSTLKNIVLNAVVLRGGTNHKGNHLKYVIKRLTRQQGQQMNYTAVELCALLVHSMWHPLVWCMHYKSDLTKCPVPG